jgi:ATP-dependent Lon protease
MSSSRSLAASTPMGLPIAQMRSVFKADEVERKLAKLQASGNDREHESLRNTWQRMLERGPSGSPSSPRACPTWRPCTT